MYHGNGDEPFHAMASKAITAYLAALPAPDGLVERLLAEATAFFAMDGEYDISTGHLLHEAATVIQTLQRERDELAVERDRCHARLEIDHVWVMGGNDDCDLERLDIPLDKRDIQIDGIEARDATISVLEQDLSAAEQQVRDMREGQREAFIPWVWAWVKKRFGVWITHNTAKGAFAEYQESARLLLKEDGE